MNDLLESFSDLPSQTQLTHFNKYRILKGNMKTNFNVRCSRGTKTQLQNYTKCSKVPHCTTIIIIKYLQGCYSSQDSCRKVFILRNVKISKQYRSVCVSSIKFMVLQLDWIVFFFLELRCTKVSQRRKNANVLRWI